jgi:hypothetical protein
MFYTAMQFTGRAAGVQLVLQLESVSFFASVLEFIVLEFYRAGVYLTRRSTEVYRAGVFRIRTCDKAKCLNYQGLATSERRSRSRNTRLGS